jgi:hypothetical protein
MAIRTAFLSRQLDWLVQLFGDDRNLRRLLTMTRAGDVAAAEAVVRWLLMERYDGMANKTAYGLVTEHGAASVQAFVRDAARNYLLPKGQPCTAANAGNP